MKLSKQQIREQIVRYSKELRLPSLRQDFEQRTQQASEQKSSYEEYLLDLLGHEYHSRVYGRPLET